MDMMKPDRRLCRHRPAMLSIVVLLAAAPACDSMEKKPRPTRGVSPRAPANDQTLSREDREVLEEAKRKKAELKKLRANPDRYIRMIGKLNTYDKGIINDYTQVTGAELKNSSSYDVYEIKGEIELQTKAGGVMAKVPITFNGELRAGETKRLTAKSRTISGSAHQGMLTITSAKVHE